jgi:hypothetical protein
LRQEKIARARREMETNKLLNELLKKHPESEDDQQDDEESRKITLLSIEIAISKSINNLQLLEQVSTSISNFICSCS